MYCNELHVFTIWIWKIGAKLESFGLWTHCFRSLPDPNDPAERRFFVGCHWIFDPFTKGYDEIKGFLLPCNIKINSNFDQNVKIVNTLLYLFCSLYSGNSVFLFNHVLRNVSIRYWIINVSSLLYARWQTFHTNNFCIRNNIDHIW